MASRVRIFLIAGCLWAVSNLARAAIVYVNSSAAGSNDGTSWANAYTSLQSALAAAASGAEIWVAAGTYKPTATSTRTISFALKDGVAIYGGFAGTESSRGQRNPSANVTVLSGDIATLGTASDNSLHVVTADSTVTATAVLDGFTITAGQADGASAPDDRGAGLLIASGSPTIAHCVVAGNHAGSRGGGIRVDGGAAVLSDCSFLGNTAGVAGGGISAGVVTSLTVTRCVVVGNSTSDATRGGGIDVTNNVAAADCLIAQNSGNGVEYFQGGNSLLNSTVTGHPSYGVAVLSGTSTIANSILWGDAIAEVFLSGSLNASYCDVQGGFPGTGNISSNPLFTNPAAQDWRLAAGSPAVDAGSNAAVPGGLTTDLAGLPRFFDDPSAPDTGAGTAPIVDMGAYERIPFSITNPSSQTVCAGVSVSFSTTASGLGPFTYRWRKNGVDLSNGGSISGVTLATLTIDPVAAGNAGNYDVVVTDGIGQSLTSTAASLTVNATPATPVAGNNGPICIYATLNLTASTIPGATYSWTGPNGFTSSLQNPSILYATSAAAGSYFVTATIGSCSSAAAHTDVVVIDPPTLGLIPDGRSTRTLFDTNCGTSFNARLEGGRSYELVLEIPFFGAGTISMSPSPFVQIVRADGTFLSAANRAACSPATWARVVLQPSAADAAPGPIRVIFSDPASAPFGIRARLEETTLYCPRWSVNGYQALVVLRNSSDCDIHGEVRLLDSGGSLLAALPFGVNAGGAAQLSVPTGLGALAGSAYVEHDGPSGGLQGGIYMIQPGGAGAANFRWPFVEVRSYGASDGR